MLELERRPHTNNVSFALLELEDPLQQYEVPAPKPVLFNLVAMCGLLMHFDYLHYKSDIAALSSSSSGRCARNADFSACGKTVGNGKAPGQNSRFHPRAPSSQRSAPSSSTSSTLKALCSPTSTSSTADVYFSSFLDFI